MRSSLTSQIAAVKAVASLRPADVVRAGLARNPQQAELFGQQVRDAVDTLERIAGDERIRRTIEKSMSE